MTELPPPLCFESHSSGDPEPTPAFSVVVDLEGGDSDDGNVTVTEVGMRGNRQSLTGVMASPNLDLLIGFPCGLLGNPTLAQFSISTAKIPRSASELTYVEVNIFDFTATTPSGDARFTVGFVPDTVLPFKDRLFPSSSTTPNVLAGSEIGVSASPDHDDACEGMITQDWTITASKD